MKRLIVVGLLFVALNVWGQTTAERWVNSQEQFFIKDLISFKVSNVWLNYAVARELSPNQHKVNELIKSIYENITDLTIDWDNYREYRPNNFLNIELRHFLDTNNYQLAWTILIEIRLGYQLVINYKEGNNWCTILVGLY